MIVKYVNSRNESIEFINDNIIPTSGYLHNRKWNVVKENNVTSLEISEVTYSITLTLRGAEQKKKLDEMCDVFEYDCITNNCGTLYFGDYKIKCFIITSNTSVSNINTRTDVQLGIFCPKNEWITEKKYELEISTSEEINVKKYAYNYPYNYPKKNGSISIINDSICDSDFILKFYGPCANPFVKINEITYQIDKIIDEGDYVEINSEENTIFAYVDGEKTNYFNYRNKSRDDFFIKIPPGLNNVNWNSNFKADLVVYDKRGEAKWIQ